MADQVGSKLRRTNPERSAETRLNVLEGVVAALNQVGYGSVTTDVTCRFAGVTRGGLLHHFPSKAGLMAAVAQHCLGRMAEERRARREDEPGDEADLLMESLLDPYGVALSELIVASRSDGELKARFSPIIDELMVRQAHVGARMAAEAGAENPSDFTALIYLHMAARRGLAMLALAGAPSDMTTAALRLLRGYGREMRCQIADLPTD